MPHTFITPTAQAASTPATPSAVDADTLHHCFRKILGIKFMPQTTERAENKLASSPPKPRPHPYPLATSIPSHNATPATSAPPPHIPTIPVPALTRPSALPPPPREHAGVPALDCTLARARACTVVSICWKNFSDNYLLLIGTRSV